MFFECWGSGSIRFMVWGMLARLRAAAQLHCFPLIDTSHHLRSLSMIGSDFFGGTAAEQAPPKNHEQDNAWA